MRWVVTAVISCVPFGVACLILKGSGQFTPENIHRQPQLVFVALVLGASTLYDVLTCSHVRRGLLLQVSTGYLILIVPFSGILYGIHFALLNAGVLESFDPSIFFKLGVIFTGSALLGTPIVQFKIAKSETPSYV